MLRETFIVAENQRGLLIKDGRLLRVLEPGRHVYWRVGGRLLCELFEAQGVFTSPWAALMEKNHPDLADRYFMTVRAGADEVAVVSLDGRPTMIVRPGEVIHVWKVLQTVDVVRIRPDETPEVPRAELAALEKAAVTSKVTSPIIVPVAVGAAEQALVFVDGVLTRTLGPGRYGFWQVGRKVTSKLFDTRAVPLEVTAQEILTKDRVSVRVTLSAFVQVLNAEKAALSTPDYREYLYKLVQFAVREAIGGRTLDEVLNDRMSVDTQIEDHVRREMGDIGVTMGDLGIKDVILPGEMRVLINKVVEAEKTAQANLIRRREEVAATRSLLNTARLMEDNPTLLRLKELEALERVTDKIGHMEVHTGTEGLGSIVDRLVSLGPRV